MAEGGVPGEGGFQLARAFVSVDPDADSFEEQLEAELADVSYVVKIPVVPDTGDFAGEVDAAVADAKSAVSVPVVPDAAGFAAKVDAAVAESDAAVEVPVNPNAAGFSEKLAAEVEAAKAAVEVPVVPDTAGFAEKTEAEAAVAAEASGATFAEKFSSVAAGAPLFPAAAAERDAEIAGEEAGAGFGARFSALLSKLPAPLAGMMPGVEAEGAEAGELAGSSFVGRMKSVLTGDLPLLETALGAGFVAVTALMATKFQAAMEQIHTQAGVGQSAIAGLSSGVLALAGKVGESPDSLAAALYHVESSFQSVGISGKSALALVQIAAEGARVGGADLVDVTNALDSTIVAGVPGIHSYSQAMGALNSIVGSGDMTMQNLADALGSGVMAVAKSYGQTIYQVGAALATLGDNNIRGAKAATDLRMSWQALQAPLTSAGPILDSIGLSMTQLGQTMEHQGMTAAIQQFVDHLEASKIPVADWGQYVTEIFGKRAGVGIGIFIDQLDRLKGKIPDIEKGADDFGGAWVSAEATTSQKLHDLESAFEALAVRIGTALLPSVNSFLGGIDKGLPVVEHFASSVAHMVAPFVGDFFTGLSAILKVLFGPLRDITLDVGAFAAAWVVLDAVMAINPFVLIGVALITLTGLIIKYHKQIFDTITTTWGDVESFFAGIYDKIFKPVVTAFDDIKNFVASSFDGWWETHGQEVETVWDGVWMKISSTFTTVWDGLVTIAKSGWDAVADIVAVGVTVFQGVWNTAWLLVSTVFTSAWDAIMAYIKVWWETLEALFKAAWDVVVGIFSVALDLLTGNWSQAWTDAKNTVEQVWNIIQAYFRQVWSTISALFTQELNVVKSLLSATWSSIETDTESVWNSIVKFFKTIWSGIETGFTNTVNGIKTVWSTLSAIFETPVKFLVNTVYDNGIARLWNDVAGAIPGIPKLPIVSFAGGGRVTQGTGPKSDDVLARVSKGETVVSADHSRLLAPVFKAVGVPGYAEGGIPGGGVLGDIGHAVGSAASAVGGAISDVLDVGKIVAAVLTGNTTAFGNALDSLVHTDTSGGLATMMTAIPKTMISDSLTGIASAIAKAVSAAKAAASGAAGGGAPGNVASAAVEALMKSMAAARGWTGAQWTALYDVEMREAGFSLTARNPSSGAYGLAQFINGPGEYAQYGGNSSSASGQITGMLNYIAQRYGTPAGAEAHEQEYGWYDQGGYLPPGMSAAMNASGVPERVLPPGSDVMAASDVTAAMATSGGSQRPVIVQYFGTSHPTPEQQQAMIMRLTQAVAMA